MRQWLPGEDTKRRIGRCCPHCPYRPPPINKNIFLYPPGGTRVLPISFVKLFKGEDSVDGEDSRPTFLISGTKWDGNYAPYGAQLRGSPNTHHGDFTINRTGRALYYVYEYWDS